MSRKSGLSRQRKSGSCPRLEMVIWVAVGGRGTLAGAVLGAVSVNLGRSLLTNYFPELWPFILGGLFVVVVLLFPDGLVGIMRQIQERIHNDESDRPFSRGRAAMSEHGSIIYLEGVVVDYDGFKALNNLNFIVNYNELRVVIGPNGAGKTTLLDVICGKTSPSRAGSFSARIRS